MLSVTKQPLRNTPTTVFLHMWASWSSFEESIIGRTIAESVASPAVWTRLGWSGAIATQVDGVELEPDQSEDCELLYLHWMLLLHTVHRLLLFAALYQTWPWSSCRFTATAADCADELAHARETHSVVAAIEKDTRPTVQGYSSLHLSARCY